VIAVRRGSGAGLVPLLDDGTRVEAILTCCCRTECDLRDGIKGKGIGATKRVVDRLVETVQSVQSVQRIQVGTIIICYAAVEFD
jgi:hypothetical protein